MTYMDVIQTKDGFEVLNGNISEVLERLGYSQVPFVGPFYDEDGNENYLCWVTAYTTDIRYETFDAFCKRIREVFMNWYSKEIGLPIK